jgi:hypothetical protein
LATVNTALHLWYLPTVVASFLPSLTPAELPVVDAPAEAPAVIATADVFRQDFCERGGLFFREGKEKSSAQGVPKILTGC